MTKLCVTIGDNTNGSTQAILAAVDEALKDTDLVALEAWDEESGDMLRTE